MKIQMMNQTKKKKKKRKRKKEIEKKGKSRRKQRTRRFVFDVCFANLPVVSDACAVFIFRTD